MTNTNPQRPSYINFQLESVIIQQKRLKIIRGYSQSKTHCVKIGIKNTLRVKIGIKNKLRVKIGIKKKLPVKKLYQFHLVRLP